MSEDIKAKVNNHLELIKEKTGVNPTIILSILGVALGFTIIGFLDEYITCIVGIVLPTYWTIKAIESHGKDDDRQWLTYWAVFGIFSYFDLFANFILRFIPFYFVLKQVFLVWCFMPNTQGALFIYNKFVYPFFTKYESKVTDKLKKVKDASKVLLKKEER